MLNVNYKVVYGEITYQRKDGGKPIKILYHEANCDGGAFIYHFTQDGKKYAQLWFFIDGKEHIRNIMNNDNKGQLFGDEVKKVRLNIYYREARMILEACCKSGYKVECYYKEPEGNK